LSPNRSRKHPKNRERHVCTTTQSTDVRFNKHSERWRAVKSLYSCEELRSQFRDPPARWRRAEEFVIEEYGLVEDHGSWHDARAEDDEPIEIKSCA
jgi:hypothetical protein